MGDVYISSAASQPDIISGNVAAELLRQLDDHR